MKARISLFIMIAVLALVTQPLFAQDATPPANNSHPLIEMLALIPDTPAAHDGVPTVSYVDYRALEMAWPGVPTYQSWAEWNAASEAKDLGAGLWNVNFQRVTSGPTFWNYFRQTSETPEILGFDLFEIDRALVFGKPPAIGQILAGEFDEDAIIAASTANDYKAAEIEGVTVLQRADGESGSKMDISSRNPANIFGGDLGLKEPFAIMPGYILNSRSDEMLESMIQAHTGSQSNLSGQADYIVAAQAMTQDDGLLVQALFFDLLDVGVLAPDPALLVIGMDPTQAAAVLEKFAADQQDHGPLPPYTLAVMADRQEEGEQVILVALVYDTPDMAEVAAMTLTTRLATFSNTFVTKSDVPLIDEIEGASMSEPRVYADEESGTYIAIAETRYPMPEPALEGDSGRPTGPGILFRRWVNAIYQRGFYPLAISE